jgi:hypothetical protein
MEGSRIPAVERRTTGTARITQVGLLIASLGAFLVIFDLFGLATAGLFLGAGGAALAAPGGAGKRWYICVAGGAVVAMLSRLVAESAETAGGWLAVIGALAILVGTCLGFPVKGEREMYGR